MLIFRCITLHFANCMICVHLAKQSKAMKVTGFLTPAAHKAK